MSLLKHFYDDPHILRRFHCGDGGKSMTLQFVDGILAAMLPSMLTVAWLVWRAA
jgi:hypothetical protein